MFCAGIFSLFWSDDVIGSVGLERITRRRVWSAPLLSIAGCRTSVCSKRKHRTMEHVAPVSCIDTRLSTSAMCKYVYELVGSEQRRLDIWYNATLDKMILLFGQCWIMFGATVVKIEQTPIYENIAPAKRCIIANIFSRLKAKSLRTTALSVECYRTAIGFVPFIRSHPIFVAVVVSKIRNWLEKEERLIRKDRHAKDYRRKSLFVKSADAAAELQWKCIDLHSAVRMLGRSAAPKANVINTLCQV